MIRDGVTGARLIGSISVGQFVTLVSSLLHCPISGSVERNSWFLHEFVIHALS